jgi:hypothetical protein
MATLNLNYVSSGTCIILFLEKICTVLKFSFYAVVCFISPVDFNVHTIQYSGLFFLLFVALLVAVLILTWRMTDRNEEGLYAVSWFQCMFFIFKKWSVLARTFCHIINCNSYAHMQECSKHIYAVFWF